MDAGPARGERGTVRLQVRTGRGFVTVDRSGTDAHGRARFVEERPRRATAVRVVTSGHGQTVRSRVLHLR